eukprot:Skav211011  [mRNA]  locus=scaffold134:27649:29942:+ [translate_table: standard]
MPAPPATMNGFVPKQYAAVPPQYQVPKVMARPPQMAAHPVGVAQPVAYGKAPGVAYQARPVMVKNPDGTVTYSAMPPQYQVLPPWLRPGRGGHRAPVGQE